MDQFTNTSYKTSVKKLWDPIVSTAEDLQKTAGRLAADGIKTFRAQLGNIPLLSATQATKNDTSPEQDETHYFLVPIQSEPSGYRLYSARVLPDRIGPENTLPKLKVFHLPVEGTAEEIARLLLQQLKSKSLAKINPDSPLADRLELVADEIDKQCLLVSGGLLLVGGVVAIANPFLAAGIVGKALLPGIGSKLSSHGFKHASSWLRSKSRASAESEAEKSARSEVKKLKPETRINPVLALLYKTLHSEENSFDPLLESATLFNENGDNQNTRLGIQATLACYEEEENLPATLNAWLSAIKDWR